MNSCQLRTFPLVFCLFLLFFAHPAEAQKKSCASQVEYENVLNYFFPGYLVGLGNGYSLILKYEAQNQPEIQINVFHISPGNTEVYLYEYQPVKNSPSMSIQFQEIQRKNCDASFQQIIGQIKVLKTKINLTEAEVLKIRADFFDALKKSNDFENLRSLEKMKSNLASVVLHSPYYQVVYGGEGSIRLSGAGNSVNGEAESDESPFIEWMRGVYKMVRIRKNS